MSLQLVLSCLAVCFLAVFAADAAPPSPRPFNVRDFGAKGEGESDATPAFQQALEAAGRAGGGTVFAPRGDYHLRGHLVIPAHVTLEGEARGPFAWGEGARTTLYAYAGKGNAEGTPFIHLAGVNATLKGLSIAYPEQQPMADEPIPYPWTISGSADNVSVIDVFLLNPYQAINFTGAGRHFISGVYGQPLFRGIRVDYCLDVGRIENVHFWPFWTAAHETSPLHAWTASHGIAFEIGRSDWQYMFNTFCLGYKIGYRFYQSEHGAANGNFIGLGADVCQEAVVVENCQPAGLLFLNGQFVALVGDASQGLRVAESNSGSVNLQNCTFWGPSNRIATIAGQGAVTFLGCNFREWDKHERGEPAIHVSGGRLTLQGCQFGSEALGVEVAPATRSAIILGNQAEGGLRVKNAIGKAAQVALNETEESALR